MRALSPWALPVPYDCVATHNSNTIITFADDTTVIGLITDNDETVYREEVRDLAVWCQDNNLSLQVSNTKGADRGLHTPIHIDRSRALSSFVHIIKDLSWSKHINTVVKMARQCLFPLRRLKKFGIGPQILKKLYSCTIESILTG